MGFCNKTWRNKGKILYKKEEEMRHLILIAPNNNYFFYDIRKYVYGGKALARKL